MPNPCWASLLVWVRVVGLGVGVQSLGVVSGFLEGSGKLQSTHHSAHNQIRNLLSPMILVILGCNCIYE